MRPAAATDDDWGAVLLPIGCLLGEALRRAASALVIDPFGGEGIVDAAVVWIADDGTGRPGADCFDLLRHELWLRAVDAESLHLPSLVLLLDQLYELLEAVTAVQLRRTLARHGDPYLGARPRLDEVEDRLDLLQARNSLKRDDVDIFVIGQEMEFLAMLLLKVLDRHLATIPAIILQGSRRSGAIAPLSRRDEVVLLWLLLHGLLLGLHRQLNRFV